MYTGTNNWKTTNHPHKMNLFMTEIKYDPYGFIWSRGSRVSLWIQDGGLIGSLLTKQGRQVRQGDAECQNWNSVIQQKGGKKWSISYVSQSVVINRKWLKRWETYSYTKRCCPKQVETERGEKNGIPTPRDGNNDQINEVIGSVKTNQLCFSMKEKATRIQTSCPTIQSRPKKWKQMK